MRTPIVSSLCVILLLSGVLQAQMEGHQHETSQPRPKTEEPRVLVEVPTVQQARIGLKTTVARKTPVSHTIRTVGIVATDQGAESHIHIKVTGWIESIFADFVGRKVSKGDPLFSLYSPEIFSTEEEYVSARKQGVAGNELATTALERLRLWGVSAKELKRLQTSLTASRVVVFESPQDGYIINKNAISGMYITPEMELYLVADLSRVWISVTLYEFDAASVIVGDTATVELPYGADFRLEGKIDYIYPQIEVQSRAAKARIRVANSKLKLKPGMYTNVVIQKNLGDSLVIPDDAAIDTGLRYIVFVKKDVSHFEPREIKVGPRVGGELVVLSGLKEGEQVVTNAQFLIDAESKLKAAVQKRPFEHSGHSQ